MNAASLALPVDGPAFGLDSLLHRHDPDDLDHRDAARIEGFVTRIAPWLRRYFRAEVRGLERIPEGAGIYVGNHNGGAVTPDAYLFGSAVYEARGLADLPYALAHDIIVTWPLLRQFFVPFGAVRASHENASRLCRAGKKLLVYPGGDAEAMRPFRDRNRIVFGARRGYVKLALRNQVPIIPVVSHGAHSTAVILDDGKWLVRRLGLDRRIRLNAWPTTLSFPWGITFGPPPPYIPFPSRIRIEVLPPIHFERSGPEAAKDDAFVEACHETVTSAMQAALDRLARS
ncbi:MAG: acyltransferase family protein [Deltaproteobacteria bacterium]|nr:acyltransferase family protein [Deltaproteobacteria bacterium]